MHPLPSLRALAHATQAAGAPIHEHFRLIHQSTTKHDGTPVSAIDLAVQERLLNWVRTWPHIGFIGEEGDDFGPDYSYALYVDPLDGTAAYLRGLPVATVAVSLVQRVGGDWWEPISSIVHDPITQWTWAASKDGQRFFQRNPRTEELLPLLSSPAGFPWRVTAVAWRNAPCNLEAIRTALLADREMEHQSFGATALSGGLIASGLADAVLFGGKSAVETVAMSLLVRSVGGVATNLSGDPLGSYKLTEQNGKFDLLLPNGSIMSSCQTLTDRLVEIVQRVG